MAWLRLYDNLSSDHKVMQLDSSHFKTWVLCLCNAKKNDGKLECIEILSFELRLREDVCQKHLDHLCAVGLIDKEGECYQPHNWSKFQYDSDNSRARTKEYRERKKGVTCDATVTSQHRHGDALRIQSTDTDNKTPLSPLLLSPRSSVSDWGERLRAAHPKGSSEGAVALFMESNRERLGDAAFDEFAARVYRSHVAWCEFWAQDGNRFAKKLEDWLTTGEYDKTPPRAVSGGNKRLVDMFPEAKSNAR
jgi:hypothetical protein